MAKGQLVTPEVENLIACVYEKHHGKWKAPRVRQEVEFILLEKDESSPEGFPSLSKVQKILATVRRNQRNPSPLDGPWSISAGIAQGVEIPTEALPFVLLTWVFMKDAWAQDLTVREARWLGRLYGIAKVILINLGPEASMEAKSDAMGPFLRLACLYAATERITALTGKRDSRVTLDFTLWELVTGQSARPELLERIFPDKQQKIFQTDKGWLFKVTKKDQAFMRKTWKKLGFAMSDLYELNQLLGVSFELDEPVAKKRKREAQHERQHNAKR